MSAVYLRGSVLTVEIYSTHPALSWARVLVPEKGIA